MDLANLPAWVGEYGPVGFVVFTVLLMMLRGWLMPRATVDRLVQSAEMRAEEWKATSLVDRARADQADAQLAALTAEMGTQTQLIRALREAAARRRDP
jgi:hypothetical protein